VNLPEKWNETSIILWYTHLCSSGKEQVHARSSIKFHLNQSPPLNMKVFNQLSVG